MKTENQARLQSALEAACNLAHARTVERDELQAALSRVLAAAPQPPALGGEPEVPRNRLEAARSRFSRWNERLIDSLRSERAHVAQLQAEVERLTAHPHAAMVSHLLAEDPENYVGSVFELLDDNNQLIGEVVVTVIKDGAKGPHTLRQEAEARNAELEGLLSLASLAVEDMADIHSDNEDASSERHCRELLERINAALVGGKEQPTVEGLTDDEWQKKDDWELHDAEGEEQ